MGQSGVNPRAAVDTFNAALRTATLRMDNAASLALWAEDGVSIQPSAKVLRGKTTIGAFLERVTSQHTGAKMQSFEMRCFDVQVSGALATEWCIEHQVVTLADTSVFDGWGKIAFVLARGADGRWRIKQETWVGSEPEPGVMGGGAPAVGVDSRGG